MKTVKILMLLAIIALVAWGCTHREEKVENIIFLIGDGMGLTQVTALAAENDYRPLEMERAKYIGLQKTYSANNKVTDSAASGTALACGEKTNNGMVGLDPDMNELQSSLRVAQELGKATGLVVTTTILDATPAAFYAHSPKRRDYELIASQLIDSGIDVLAGAFGKEIDEAEPLFREKAYYFTRDKKEFLAAPSAPAAMLTAERAMKFVTADTTGIRGEYLAQATAKALDLLGRSDKEGFFLMVESSLIDYAGHDNDIESLLGEMADFDKVVKVAFDYADSHPGTLVVVTGDHETGGLTLVSKNEEDFTAGAAGLGIRFSTVGHSGTFLPVFAYGTGAEEFSGVMENTDVAKKMKKLMRSGKR